MESWGPLRAERRRREARCETFTTRGLVTTRRSILGPPAEGRPGPSDYDDDDDDHDDHDDHGDRNGFGDGNGDGNDDDGHNISEDNRNDVTLKESILSYQTRVHMDLGLVVKSQLK